MNRAAFSFQGHEWWFASRAAGVLALVLVTVSVILGLLMAGKLARRPGWPIKIMAIHEQTALAGLVAIFIHVGTLLADPWLHPGITGILIPFSITYRPVFVAMGIFAAFLALLLGPTFYLRKRIGAKLWRQAHRATILVWMLGVVHALGAGTDGNAIWLLGWVLVTTPVIIVLFVMRLRGAKTPAKPKGGNAAEKPPMRVPKRLEPVEGVPDLWG